VRATSTVPPPPRSSIHRQPATRPVGSCVSWAIDFTAMSILRTSRASPATRRPRCTPTPSWPGQRPGQHAVGHVRILTSQVWTPWPTTGRALDYTTQPDANERASARTKLSGYTPISTAAASRPVCSSHRQGLRWPSRFPSTKLRAITRQQATDYSYYPTSGDQYMAATRSPSSATTATASALQNSWGTSWVTAFHQPSWNYLANQVEEANAVAARAVTPDFAGRGAYLRPMQVKAPLPALGQFLRTSRRNSAV